jgi:hypothetical protein
LHFRALVSAPRDLEHPSAANIDESLQGPHLRCCWGVRL